MLRILSYVFIISLLPGSVSSHLLVIVVILLPYFLLNDIAVGVAGKLDKKLILAHCGFECYLLTNVATCTMMSVRTCKK